MSLRLVAGIAAGAAFALAPVASAEPIPPACVVVSAPPVHAQVGYAPTGPSGCVVLPG